MKLLFEKSVPNRRSYYLPSCDVPHTELPEDLRRGQAPRLPELSETDVCRHYSELERRAYGVNSGFYPLGSCTMKYNPKINEAIAALDGFTDLHPLQPAETAQGALEALALAEQYFCELTDMEAMTFQPAAGAHGELTGVMLIKKYHEARGDHARRKILVPDSAHGTNPATVTMCGMEAVHIPSRPDGCVDLTSLRGVVGPEVAGLMLTNPNTLGIFETDIKEITRMVHDAGGLVYYDGANLNAMMGVARPGDMGFDCVHLNLHKTFSTPHGGGGPGSGAVGCKALLAPFLPGLRVEKKDGKYDWKPSDAESIGQVKAFYGNFLVVIRALAYLFTLGGDGLKAAAQESVLNANYLMKRLAERYQIVNRGFCMHEFVMTLEREAREQGFTALDIAKMLADSGIHPPTMYFPLIVPEALMVEPTETEGKEMLDAAADLFIEAYDRAAADPSAAHAYPHRTPVGRPDEVSAARNPRLRWIP